MVLSATPFGGERPRAPASYLSPAAAAVAGLVARRCRWPLGEPAEAGFAFCGAPVRPGSSYCPAHARAAARGAGA